jgi:NodT family efflux transporter outer membrane factor (OMF) lipoprotein
MNEPRFFQKKGSLPMRLIRTFTSVVLVLAAGCAVGPDFKQPDTEMPAAWSSLDVFGTQQASSAVAGPAALAAWWTIFNDPALTGLVEKALAANLDLKIAGARVRQARAARGTAFAGLWPSLNSSASYLRSHESSSGASETAREADAMASGQVRTDLFQAGLDAAWELDIFGGTRRSIEAAEADLQAAEDNRRSVLVSLAAEVGTTYINLRGYQQQLAIARKNLESQLRTAGITRKRYEAGFANALDTANAEALAASTQSQIPLLESAERQAIYSLSVLLALEPAALQLELAPEAPLPQAPRQVAVGVPSELLRRRPDVRAAEAQLHAATARVGVATADFFPRFSLAGSFGLRGDEWQTLGSSYNHAWSGGPGVTWNIFDAGRTISNLRLQQAVQDETLAAYEKAVLAALKDVDSALVAYAKEQEHLTALTDAVTKGRKAVDLSLQLYTVGRSDYLSVLIAQRALFAYEDAWVISSRNLDITLIALYKALGGGWEEPQTAELVSTP